MYITGNNKLEPYVGKYVILEVSGRKKKFFVQDIDSYTGYIPASSYIFTNSYKIIGLSTVQNCETCQNVVNITDFTPSSAILEGSNIDLYVYTTGASALQYLWYQNDVLLFNSTSSLNIPVFDETTVGTYYVSVSSECNIINSNSSVLTLLLPTSTTSTTVGPTTTVSPTTTIIPPTTVPPTTQTTSSTTSTSTSTTVTSTTTTSTTVTSTTTTSTTVTSTTTVTTPPPTTIPPTTTVAPTTTPPP